MAPLNRAARRLLEAPIDTGEYGDFIDPSHKRRLAGHSSPGLPDKHAEVLGSRAYQDVVRKLARYTGINPGHQGDLQQVTMMMMQALQQVAQIERGHEEELEQAAVELVLSLPEFAAAKEARDAGEIKVTAKLTADIDLEGAQVDAEDTSDNEDLKVAKIAADLDLEVQKRKLVNMMIQGNSMNKMQAYHMAQEQVDAVDPRLMDLYGILTSVGEFGYWIFPEDMMRGAMGSGQGAGGAAHVRRGDDDGVPEVMAQGITFPMLVHELVKALMEYISYNEDMDPETRAHVSGQADTLDNELVDIKIGGPAWRSLVDLIDDQSLIPYVYDHLVRMPARAFHDTMRVIMAGGEDAEQLVRGIVRQVGHQDEGLGVAAARLLEGQYGE